jgi:hypothetical protein
MMIILKTKNKEISSIRKSKAIGNSSKDRLTRIDRDQEIRSMSSSKADNSFLRAILHPLRKIKMTRKLIRGLVKLINKSQKR